MRLRAGTLPVVMLVIMILWVLAAVLFLTTVLINAQQIDNRVGVINDTYRPIDKDLEAVALSGTTADISGQISKMAEPLTGQLRQVDEAVQAIDGTGKSIMKNATKINKNAKSINGTVKSINGTVGSINGTADAINSNVRSIGSNLSSVGGSVASINSAARGIGGSFNGTLSHVQSIDQRVVGINAHADNAMDMASDIRANLATIRGIVPRIETNATAIENNPLLLKNLSVLRVFGVMPQLQAAEARADEQRKADRAAAVPAPVQQVAPAPILTSPAPVLGGVGDLLAPPPSSNSNNSAPPRQAVPEPSEPPVVSGTGGLLGSMLNGG